MEALPRAEGSAVSRDAVYTNYGTFFHLTVTPRLLPHVIPMECVVASENTPALTVCLAATTETRLVNVNGQPAPTIDRGVDKSEMNKLFKKGTGGHYQVGMTRAPPIVNSPEAAGGSIERRQLMADAFNGRYGPPKENRWTVENMTPDVLIQYHLEKQAVLKTHRLDEEGEVMAAECLHKPWSVRRAYAGDRDGRADLQTGTDHGTKRAADDTESSDSDDDDKPLFSKPLAKKPVPANAAEAASARFFNDTFCFQLPLVPKALEADARAGRVWATISLRFYYFEQVPRNADTDATVLRIANIPVRKLQNPVIQVLD
jgi:hypothetical protein